MDDFEKRLREALAYALWRSVWRTRLADLDACRMAAADLARHLRLCGYQVRAGEPVAPHGGLARDSSQDGDDVQ